MLSFKDKVIYGSGNFTYGITLQVLATYLVFYGTAILGLPGSVVGMIIAISVIWDAISDPFMGYISDTTKNKYFGRRHLYMIVGALGLSIFNAFLWRIDAELSNNLKIILLLLIVILIKTFMTIFATPYNALGAELTEDYHEKTSIQVYRTVFFSLGLAFTTVIGMFVFFKSTELYPVGQLNPAAYANLGLTISVLVIVFSLISIIGTFKFIPNLPVVNKSEKRDIKKLIHEFKYIFNNKNYLYVICAYLSGNIATAILGSMGLHVFTYTFNMNNNEIGYLFAIMFGLSVLMQPFWYKITTKYDKKQGALLAVAFILFGSLMFILMVINRDLIREHSKLVLLYAVFSGIGFGGLITIPFSMVADTIDEGELISGNRAEGLYYGGLTFSYKISQSFAIFLLGIILDIIKFDSNLEIQTDNTVMSLGIITSIGIIIALLFALYFYSKYGLTKEKLEETKDILKERKLKV